MSDEKIYASREFLCPMEAYVDSYIKGRVFVRTGLVDADEFTASLTAELTLADCGRSITWDFSHYGYNTDSMTIRVKAEKTRKLLNDFFDALEQGLTRLETLQQEAKNDNSAA